MHTTHTIPAKMAGTGSIHDIASEHGDRVIRFAPGCIYAVVCASYYGGKGYTTHATAPAAVAHYVDLMPGGMHRQYTWIQEAKSVITTPSGGQVILDRGFHEITGFAWSGRGRVRRVDVSTDGGRNWRTAQLQEPVLARALTRFRIDWNWQGEKALLQSRVTDDTGFVQPAIRQLRAVRGSRSIYHNNAIQTWRVDPSGEVSNVHVL